MVSDRTAAPCTHVHDGACGGLITTLQSPQSADPENPNELEGPEQGELAPGTEQPSIPAGPVQVVSMAGLNPSVQSQTYCLIKCKKCKGAMNGLTRTVRKKGGQTYEYSCYVCSTKSRNRTCDCRNINTDELEKMLTDFLLERILHPFFFEDIVARMESGAMLYTAQTLGDLHKEIAWVENVIENLWQAVENGMADRDVYARIEKIKKNLPNTAWS